MKSISSSPLFFGSTLNPKNLIFSGVLFTLFFMPLDEGLKAGGFWFTLFFSLYYLVQYRKQETIWVPPMGWALFAFVGVAFLSVIFSDYQARALQGALDALRYTLFFLIIANFIDSQKKIKWVLFSLIGGILIGNIVAIYQYFFVTPGVLSMLSLGEKNSTGQVLSFFLALLLGLFFSRKIDLITRLWFTPVFLITGFTLVLTYARTFWVALFMMLIVFFLFLRDWRVPMVLGILGISVLVGILFEGQFRDKIISLKNPLLAPNMVGRYAIWEQSMKIGMDHPIWGIGLKTYGRGSMAQDYNLINPTHSHNVFIHVFAELGILGLICFLVWLFFFGQSIVKMRPPPTGNSFQGLWLGGIGSLVVLLIGGIAHPMLGSESSFMLMTNLGLMFAGFRMKNEGSNLVLSSLYSLSKAKKL